MVKLEFSRIRNFSPPTVDVQYAIEASRKQKQWIQWQPFELSTWNQKCVPKSVQTKNKRQNKIIQMDNYKIDIDYAVLNI
jgi:hypothetical protein